MRGPQSYSAPKEGCDGGTLWLRCITPIICLPQKTRGSGIYLQANAELCENSLEVPGLNPRSLFLFHGAPAYLHWERMNNTGKGPFLMSVLYRFWIPPPKN